MSKRGFSAATTKDAPAAPGLLREVAELTPWPEIERDIRDRAARFGIIANIPYDLLRPAALDLCRQARIAAVAPPLDEIETLTILYGSLIAARAKLVWLHARFCSLCDRYVAGDDILLPSVAMGRNLLLLDPLARRLDEACRQPAEPTALLIISFIIDWLQSRRIWRRGFRLARGDPDRPAHAAAGSWLAPGATQPHLSSSEKNRSSENARKLCTGEFNSALEFFPLEFFRGGELRPRRRLTAARAPPLAPRKGKPPPADAGRGRVDFDPSPERNKTCRVQYRRFHKTINPFAPGFWPRRARSCTWPPSPGMIASLLSRRSSTLGGTCARMHF
jgi:hypothetical protein